MRSALAGLTHFVNCRRQCCWLKLLNAHQPRMMAPTPASPAAWTCCAIHTVGYDTPRARHEDLASLAPRRWPASRAVCFDVAATWAPSTLPAAIASAVDRWRRRASTAAGSSDTTECGADDGDSPPALTALRALLVASALSQLLPPPPPPPPLASICHFASSKLPRSGLLDMPRLPRRRSLPRVRPLRDGVEGARGCINGVPVMGDTEPTCVAPATARMRRVRGEGWAPPVGDDSPRPRTVATRRFPGTKGVPPPPPLPLPPSLRFGLLGDCGDLDSVNFRPRRVGNMRTAPTGLPEPPLAPPGVRTCGRRGAAYVGRVGVSTRSPVVGSFSTDAARTIVIVSRAMHHSTDTTAPARTHFAKGLRMALRRQCRPSWARVPAMVCTYM